MGEPREVAINAAAEAFRKGLRNLSAHNAGINVADAILAAFAAEGWTICRVAHSLQWIDGSSSIPVFVPVAPRESREERT